jgi:hypothetical protein
LIYRAFSANFFLTIVPSISINRIAINPRRFNMIGVYKAVR